MQTSIQLYTLRDVDALRPEIIADVGETSFDGVEFAYPVDETERAAIREALDDAGIVASSAHVKIDRLESAFDAVVEDARVLGYDDVVVPWLDPEHWETVEAVEATAERLSGLAADLADEGLTMHYHNHDQEFVETGDGVAFHLLADMTDDLLFEVDAGWALAGGTDPVALIDRYGDRITYLHVKDVLLDEDASPELGEGDLDIPAVASAAHDVGAEWLVFEDDQPADPSAALSNAADILSRYA